MSTSMTDTVETQVWEPDTERPGYLRLVRPKTVREVYEELLAIVGTRSDYGNSVDVQGAEEYFSVSIAAGEDGPWPDGRVVVFAVTGGSEGHYTHVEVLDCERQHHCLILGKTFQGFDAAWDLAKRLARILSC